MDKQPEHTPTPWRKESGMIMARDVPILHADREPGNGTLPVERDENIGFALRACNNHDALVREIKMLVETIEDEGEHNHSPEECDVCDAIYDAKRRLAHLDEQGETEANDLLLEAVGLIGTMLENTVDGMEAAKEILTPAQCTVLQSYTEDFRVWLDKAKGRA